ncbi:MAG: hypothetical protein CVU38_05725 [Chloroflexi bacterium HGW-Chloroflexi-1]|nr:MAG: hypothetical protein CVU38_05725 [Chloroflexi bacterium HGW-Chloroflexi-1]
MSIWQSNGNTIHWKRRCTVPLTFDPSRGEIVRVRLDPVVGSEQSDERPALVISPDLIASILMRMATS